MPSRGCHEAAVYMAQYSAATYTAEGGGRKLTDVERVIRRIEGTTIGNEKFLD